MLGPVPAGQSASNRCKFCDVMPRPLIAATSPNLPLVSCAGSVLAEWWQAALLRAQRPLMLQPMLLAVGLTIGR